MAAACRCSPSTSTLATHGFVCSGHNGNCAHWLCKTCTVGGTCPQHPKAIIVPVRGLWADTRFQPETACAPPTAPLPHSDQRPEPVDLQRVHVEAAGMRGIVVTVRPQPKIATVIRLGIAGIRGHRYAVVWPGHPKAWTFPRSTTGAPSQKLCVHSAEWWPAWSQDSNELAPKLLLGLNPDLVLSIMKSPCARTRWWFLLPQTAPPLVTPPAIANMHGIDKGKPALGKHCAVPLRPYNPAIETSRTGDLRCAWCKTPKASKPEWFRTCAPDLQWFT